MLFFCTLRNTNILLMQFQSFHRYITVRYESIALQLFFFDKIQWRCRPAISRGHLFWLKTLLRKNNFVKLNSICTVRYDLRRTFNQNCRAHMWRTYKRNKLEDFKNIFTPTPRPGSTELKRKSLIGINKNRVVLLFCLRLFSILVMSKENEKLSSYKPPRRNRLPEITFDDVKRDIWLMSY